MKPRLLLVEDDADFSAELCTILLRCGHDVVVEHEAETAYARFAREPFDAVVTDLNMRGMNGIELCELVLEHRRDIPVIVMTAFATIESAVQSIRAGAFDFLTKPFSAAQLEVAVARALRTASLEREVKHLQATIDSLQPFSEMLGASAPMLGLFDLIDRVAHTDATILIGGESGTGKELVARAIHARSTRKNEKLVTVNCAALPENLLESELFGHVKGAFTDAKNARKGLFLEAAHGTLFLDEIGEMPIGVQAKLLRALETKRVRAVGSDTETDTDVRVIAATNRDLEALVEEKRFREDLFYRLNVVHLEVPPLRSRGQDILTLAQAFVLRFSEKHRKGVLRLSPSVAERLLSYSWLGNVRELQNSIERAVALARHEELGIEDLPAKVRDFVPSRFVLSADAPEDLVTLEELERRYIRKVMDAVGWNKARATEVLGIDRSTLYRKLERYKLAGPT